jgi:exodeoxyribonuclease V
MQLSCDQDLAISNITNWALNSTESYYVLSGKPGTGKSFVVNNICYMLKKHKNIWITATTNKAASILDNNLNISLSNPVITIHKLLGLVVQTNYMNGSTEIIKAARPQYQVSNKDGFIIIDEASMVNKELFGLIDKFIDPSIKVLFVGDKCQLLPIGEEMSPVFGGSIRGDELTTIHRQDQDNELLEVSDKYRHMIETGKYIFNKIKGNKNIKILNTEQEVVDVVNNYYMSDEYLDNPDYIKTLCYTNKSVDSFNHYIRNELKFYYQLIGRNLKEFPSVTEHVVLNTAYKVGNKTIPTESILHIESISDGNIFGIPHLILATNKGIIRYINSTEGNEIYSKVTKDLKASVKTDSKAYQTLAEVTEMFADIRPVYAQTVHKSQGSTYENVLINLKDINKCRDLDMLARMLYVGITRAKNKVYIYGNF